VLSVLANVKVDLREAVLQSRETVIEAIAIFAEIQIIVPLDFIVECDGEAFMGSFTLSETKRRGSNVVPRRSGGPLVRVIGSAYLGSVSVKVRPPR
jgi:predicted membrane protein